MPTSATPAYDRIGTGYARCRQTDPRLAGPIHSALGDARRVLNVGAGTGSYEPDNRHVVAVEPSTVMIAQRPTHVASALRAVAEALPFPPAAFDAAMATLTVHHWANRHAGFAEMRRVARRRVILTFDPDVHNRMWLMDYIPEIIELEIARGPSIDEVVDGIHGHTVTVLSVPHDCSDAMTIANWRHPEAYFDPMVRAGGSSLRQVDTAALQRGLRRLAEDLRNGAWLRRNGHLLDLHELDCGLRLIIGEA